MPEPAVKSQENYDLSGSRFMLFSQEDVTIADGVFQAMHSKHGGRWTFDMLYEEIVSDRDHVFRRFLTDPAKAVKAAWIKDIRRVAHEIKVFVTVPSNGGTMEVSARKFIAVDDEDTDLDQPAVMLYSDIRQTPKSMESVRKAYARRLRMLLVEFVGFRDQLVMFADLEKLASAIEAKYLRASTSVTTSPAGTSRVSMPAEGLGTSDRTQKGRSGNRPIGKKATSRKLHHK